MSNNLENNGVGEVQANEIIHKTTEIINQASALTVQNETNEGGSLKAGGEEKVSSYFTNLPIGELIATPFVELAKGQAALCEVYLQTLFQLAYDKPENAAYGSSGNSNETRILKFKFDKPIVESDGTVTKREMEINAPLLALVPLPAFLMDSADVSFEMEVNIATSSNETKVAEISSNLSLDVWKLKSSIAGKVSSNSSSSYSNTQKATYSISAHASQQGTTEGMAKLTSLLTEAMEPIVVDSK